MKKAIVTGISGQDGSYLAKLLIGKGYRVIGLISENRNSDLFRLAYLDILQSCEIRPINLLNQNAVEQLLEEVRPDEIYNLAALSSVGVSFQQPLNTFDFNTRSVMVLLEAIRRVCPKTRFYQASSSEMFGNIGRSRLPVQESFLFHPASPYGISKASAHWLTVNYREAFGLNACCGILFNHESALRPEHFVIKKVIGSALRIRDGLQAKLTLGNLAIARDWGYAPKYVEAMWAMLQRDRFEDYLICSGAFIQLKEFVFKVFAKLQMDATLYIEIDERLTRSLELDIIYGDNSKARQELGWNYNMSTDDLIDQLIRDEDCLRSWNNKRVE
ncbi:MAG TPA: GDP-mannose 4,6-dehydratase [Cyclobacteriaceae bacterium]|nr:GDP-mannose 4,6-dehydratase [Cyclobacteriaceae bacterium]